MTTVTRSIRRIALAAAVAFCMVATLSAPADAQVVVYDSFRPVTAYYGPVAPGYAPVAAGYAPVAAGYPGGYVANYSPAGNYAAVTAFSPPMASAYVANYAAEAVAAPVAVTSYYAPVAPVVAAPVVAAPVYAPVTTYYAPAAVVPLYRRGLFGGLRPARTAMYVPY